MNLPGSISSAHTLTVRAMGAPAGGVWPQLDLWVNGVKVTSWPVTGTWQNYTATVPLTGRDRIDVVFANDGFTGSEDRNLAVAWVQVDNQAALPYTRAVYDRGDGAAAFDDNDVLAGPPTLFWNGALRFVVGAGAQAYGYDRNGNRSYALSASQTDVYTYTVTNQLYAILRNGAKLERYRYDETGQRLQKQTPGAITTYVNPDYEVTNGSTSAPTSGVTTTYYSFNGQHIAMRKNGVLTYLHADHLGSTLFATDASGTVIGGNQPRYFAYGRERTSSLAALPTDYAFTGQKQDSSGLVYMNARYYDPVVGQFLSPDSIVPDTTNLFAYNRYMYVNGNPLKYNDPSGHCIWDLCIVEGIGAVELLAAAAGAAAYYGYVYSPAGQEAIANAGQAFDNLTANHAEQPPQEVVPLPVPAKPQITGTPLHTDTLPTIGETTIPGDSNTIPLLSDPLPAQRKGANLVFAKRGVSLQSMGGAISDSAEKGFHINTDVPGGELGLEIGPKNSILIRPVGSIKVNAGDYVNEVNKLLNTQTNKVVAQLNGIISANKPNSWATTQAQQLIDIIKNGNYTVQVK